LSVSKSVEKEQISKSGLEKIIESAENFADNRYKKGEENEEIKFL
jgi:hypothetical protein